MKDRYLMDYSKSENFISCTLNKLTRISIILMFLGIKCGLELKDWIIHRKKIS